MSRPAPAERGRGPSGLQWTLLFLGAFFGGGLLGALILGVHDYLAYKPDPTNCGFFCMSSATEAAEWGAFGGFAVGALVGSVVWLLALIAVVPYRSYGSH